MGVRIVDFPAIRVAVEHAGPVDPNPERIAARVIPAARCARAQHLGSRARNLAAIDLHRDWLPRSGEAPGAFPIRFHDGNVGPDVREGKMITDVDLPLPQGARSRAH